MKKFRKEKRATPLAQTGHFLYHWKVINNGGISGPDYGDYCAEHAALCSRALSAAATPCLVELTQADSIFLQCGSGHKHNNGISYGLCLSGCCKRGGGDKRERRFNVDLRAGAPHLIKLALHVNGA